MSWRARHMTTTRTFPSGGFRALRRLALQEGGMAAVEFALILPILVVLWIGGVELTQALSIDRRLNNLASAIGDLSARSKQLTYADVDNIFNIGPAAMFPYSDTGLAMRVTAVDIDGSGDAAVAWTRKEGTLPGGVSDYAPGDSMNSVVPENLRPSGTPGSQIIIAEVYYTYTPAVGYVITGGLDLDDRMFFVPRLIQYVALCESDDEDATCWS
jgi:Flp pilus assembly protein TadG